MKMKNTKVIAVLAEVNVYLESMNNNTCQTLVIADVCDLLNIVVSHKDTLTYNDLKEMKSFLEIGVRFELTGYCKFEVGVAGSTSGMWIYENDAINGCAPTNGTVISRTFLGKKQPKKYKFDLGYGEKSVSEEFYAAQDLDRVFWTTRSAYKTQQTDSVKRGSCKY